MYTERTMFRLLEEAYTGSRYLPRTYERIDAEEALRIVKEVFDLLDKVEAKVFGG